MFCPDFCSYTANQLLLTGEGKWQDAANRQMRFLANAVREHPGSGCLGMLAMMDVRIFGFLSGIAGVFFREFPEKHRKSGWRRRNADFLRFALWECRS